MFFCFILFGFSHAKSPVLLVPGLAGSQLEYEDSSVWNLLWIDGMQAAFDIDNFVDKLKTTFNSNTFSSSSFASNVRAKNWKSVRGIDKLDSPLGLFEYFHDLIDALKNAGFADEVDLFGAPYDFRLESYESVKQPNGLFSKLKSLIESMYNTNNNQAVVIVSHSEGSAIIRHFFANYANIDQAWKDKHIKVWVSASGAFAGAPAAYHTLVSCKASVLPSLIDGFIDGEDIHEALEFWAGVYWMLPNSKVFSSNYQLVTVTNPSKTYTVGNMSTGFQDVYDGRLTGPATFSLNAITSEFNAPNVEMRVYYGTGLPTPKTVTYTAAAGNWWDCDAATVDLTGDGDQTVPIESLEAPHKWDGTNTKPIHYIPMSGVEHVSLLNNTDFIQAVVKLVSDESEPSIAVRINISSVRSCIALILFFFLFSLF